MTLIWSGYAGRVARPQTLADVPLGEQVTLGAPDVDPSWARRLAELGLRPGAVVTVLLRTAGGGRVIGLTEDRIALDRWTLRRLLLAKGEPTVSDPGAGSSP